MCKDKFSFDDVSKLMYKTILKNAPEKELLEIARIGVISGFVDLNDEIEVIVKFMGGVEQYTKEEFCKKLTLISEGLEE